MSLTRSGIMVATDFVVVPRKASSSVAHADCQFEIKRVRTLRTLAERG